MKKSAHARAITAVIIIILLYWAATYLAIAGIIDTSYRARCRLSITYTYNARLMLRKLSNDTAYNTEYMLH